MACIHVLDEETINQIAAGEVVERPLNIVKELVENSMDAGANAITVEIKEGGITFIRVTDNGAGIEKEQVKTAFYRHATSKISRADDLCEIITLGFRGEALSSIAAVSQVELITKTKENLVGTRFTIEGGREGTIEEIGAPNGTTILVRNLFFNTPPRKKFLRTVQTEAGYISDMMEHLALSRTDISFQYIVNGTVRFQTSGNGDLKEVIYRIYGREITNHLIPIQGESNGLKIEGFFGEPILNRANRNFETLFVNKRFVRSQLICHSIEEGCKNYLMQHKYPFCVLSLSVPPSEVDVNVHPTKMDVRFLNRDSVCTFISAAITASLRVHEMIPEVKLEEEKDETISYVKKAEPFEERRMVHEKETEQEEAHIPLKKILGDENVDFASAIHNASIPTVIKANDSIVIEKPVQLDLFEEKVLTKEARGEYRIIGQIFDTYWIVAFKDKLFFIDQHAAHEKVKYERLMAHLHEKEIVSQNLNPPIVVSLTGVQENILKESLDCFRSLGFEIEAFGGNEYALRAIPMDLYGKDGKTLFLDILDELEESGGILPSWGLEAITEKIASMSCKAAVKGNNSLKTEEMNALIDELLTLENPYNCPHGRPTIFSMSRYEIEKKFKRIV